MKAGRGVHLSLDAEKDLLGPRCPEILWGFQTCLAEVLRQPEALEKGKQAMHDYCAVITAEYTKRNETDEAALLAARDRFQKKKSIGDGTP